MYGGLRTAVFYDKTDPAKTGLTKFAKLLPVKLHICQI